MPLSRPPFPMAVDATLIRDFRTCPRKAFYTHFEHWKLKGERIDPIAGHSFATGLEVARREYYQNKTSADDALIAGAKALIGDYGHAECPDDNPKSLANVLGALAEYFKVHGFDTDHLQPLALPDGKKAIEFDFALPLPFDVRHPESGDPILYAGRCDMLASYHDMVFVVDEKTTKQLGPTWPKQWILRSQITGYCWAGCEFGYPIAGAIIRGLAIRKYDYGHAEVILYRQPWQIEQWLEQTRRDILRMIALWEEGYWDMNLDDSCGAYGGCAFLNVCSSRRPEEWLPAQFEKRVWNPLRHIETKIEDLSNA